MDPLSKDLSGDILWLNKPVQIEDFISIRKFVNNLLDSTKTTSPSNSSLSDIPALLNALESTIPWLSDAEKNKVSQLVQYEDHLKKQPRKPNVPQHIVSDNKYEQHITELNSSLRRSQRSIELGNTPFPKKQLHNIQSKIQASHGQRLKYLSWFQANQAWQKQLLTPLELKELKLTVKNIWKNYGNSIPQKKIIKKLKDKFTKLTSDSFLICKKVLWEVLPPGENIGQFIYKILPVIQSRLQKKTFDPKRIEAISKLNPDKAYIGKTEFDGYFVFLFEDSDKVVLECPWYGNAIYLLSKEHWPTLSKLSKSNLLNSKTGHVTRLIHDPHGNWLQHLKCVIKGEVL